MAKPLCGLCGLCGVNSCQASLHAKVFQGNADELLKWIKIMTNSPGYSWLGISPEPKKKGTFSNSELKRLHHDYKEGENLVHSLEKKVMRYHELCLKYEAAIGTKQAPHLLEQMKEMKNEIETLSKTLNKTVDDAWTILDLHNE